MDIIDDISTQFITWQINRTGDPDDFISSVNDELYKLKKAKDKIRFLKNIIDGVTKASEEHSKVCRDPKTCQETKGYNHSLFYLNQELDEYSENIQDDLQDIDYQERRNLNQKLDLIISELESLKTDAETIQKGQVIIVEAFAEEFDELKNLYHLGKKNWRQNFFGKFGEMGAGGIVSETISKEVVDIMKGMGKEVKQLLISD